MPDVYISKSPVASNQSTDKPVTRNRQPEIKHDLPGHSHNPLAAFFHWPDRVSFKTQEKGEKIVLLLRKHPITNVPWILVAIVLALAPLLLQFFPLLSFLPQNFQTVAVLFWYLIVLAFILEEALSWFFNVYIVTDERIVDVDFYNLIYREISDAKIDKIQDVTHRVGGVVPTLFNYGDILIQTAGTIPNFDFVAVPNPSEVARILQELRTEEEIEALEGRAR